MDYYTLTYDETKIKFPILVRDIKTVLYHYNDNINLHSISGQCQGIETLDGRLDNPGYKDRPIYFVCKYKLKNSEAENNINVSLHYKRNKLHRQGCNPAVYIYEKYGVNLFEEIWKDGRYIKKSDFSALLHA